MIFFPHRMSEGLPAGRCGALQSGHDKAARSRDDIAKAVRGLTPAEWIKLRKSAAFWATGSDP